MVPHTAGHRSHEVLYCRPAPHSSLLTGPQSSAPLHSGSSHSSHNPPATSNFSHNFFPKKTSYCTSNSSLTESPTWLSIFQFSHTVFTVSLSYTHHTHHVHTYKYTHLMHTICTHHMHTHTYTHTSCTPHYTHINHTHAHRYTHFMHTKLHMQTKHTYTHHAHIPHRNITHTQLV